MTPTSGLNTSGIVGGPFSPNSKAYTVMNTGGQPMNWTATKTKTWTTLSSGGGTLAAGASTTLTVTINSSANALAAGSHTDTLTITNATNSNGHTMRGVALTVLTPGTLAVTPSTGLTTSGPMAAGMSQTSKTYTLTNTGGTAIEWSAENTEPWVTLSSPATGMLNPGANTTLTVSINNLASSLEEGTHTDYVTFTNMTNGGGDTGRPDHADDLEPDLRDELDDVAEFPVWDAKRDVYC